MTKSKLISTEIQDKINELNVNRSYVTKLSNEVANSIVDIFKNLMADCEYIEAIRWNQYTPHFNDGSPCEFGVNDVEFRFAEKLVKNSDDEDREDFISEWYLKSFFDAQADIMNFEEIAKVEAIVKEIQDVHEILKEQEHALQERFGDGVEITVSRDGIEVEDYSHD